MIDMREIQNFEACFKAENFNFADRLIILLVSYKGKLVSLSKSEFGREINFSVKMCTLLLLQLYLY